MLSKVKQFPWLRILIWALVLGVLVSVFKDWGNWERFPMNALWRVLIVGAGGIVGWLMNLLGGFYVGMGTNVIESMGLFRFSSETPKKIENGFIFVVSLVAAIIAALTIR
jgi:hypothetical protein